MGQSAEFSYHYYKRENRVDYLVVNIGSYASLPEAVTAAGQINEYAHTVFAQKGDYTFEDRSASYRFRADRSNQTVILDISLRSDGTETSEGAYFVTLYQNFFR